MDYRIREIIAKVENDLTEPLIIFDLAASVNLSVSHFQHLFKKEVGFGIIKYSNNLRIQKARELLETTNLQIKEIRRQVGATNAAYFLGDFKRKIGETPSDYRKIYRKSRNEYQIAEMDI